MDGYGFLTRWVGILIEYRQSLGWADERSSEFRGKGVKS